MYSLTVAQVDDEIQNPYFSSPLSTLYLGNMLQILEHMEPESVDMIFADPPYNLSNDGFTVHAGKQVSVNKGAWDKSKGIDGDICAELYRFGEGDG